MELPSRRVTRLRALLTSIAACLLMVAAFWVAATGASDFGLTLESLGQGEALATWVAPGGPAWSAGIHPGEVVLVPLGWREHQWGTLHHTGGDTSMATLLPASVPPVDPFDAAIFALGLALGALGVVALAKSIDKNAGWAFWRMSLWVGASLALVPAASRGIAWTLGLQFVALRLSGPAIVAMAWTLPAGASASRVRSHVRLWAPAFLLLLTYPACWVWPMPLFDILQPLDGIVLLSYIIAASLLLITRWWKARAEPLARAQLRLITLGVAGGFAPFLLLTVLPLLLLRRAILPFQVSILALVLLPACVAAAIIRAEFLGITSLVHRRPLRWVIGGVLLVGLGACAGLGSVLVSQVFDWPSAATVAVFGTLCAGVYSVLYRRVACRVELLLLRDTYSPAQAFLELGVELTTAASAETLALCAVARLGTLLDLSFAALVSPTAVYTFHHPRSTLPSEIAQSISTFTQPLLTGDGVEALETREFERILFLFVPIRLPANVDTVPDMTLCLGPKRSGDVFTEQDRALLTTLSRHIAILMHNHALHAELDTRLHELELAVAERSALTERLITVSERERRELAGALHDDAIQLAGQVERLLGDATAETDAGSRMSKVIGEAWKLSREVTEGLRSFVSALHPPPLEMAGVVPALQAFLRDAQRTSGVACALVYEPSIERCRLAPQDERLLYQVAREAVVNALRHAAASAVTVELTLTKSNGALLVVRDDGRGFTPQPLGHALAAGHLGLALLHERVHERGGRAQIATAPDAGTTISIEIPSVETREEVLAHDDSHRSRR